MGPTNKLDSSFWSEILTFDLDWLLMLAMILFWCCLFCSNHAWKYSPCTFPTILCNNLPKVPTQVIVTNWLRQKYITLFRTLFPVLRTHLPCPVNVPQSCPLLDYKQWTAESRVHQRTGLDSSYCSYIKERRKSAALLCANASRSSSHSRHGHGRKGMCLFLLECLQMHSWTTSTAIKAVIRKKKS